MVKFYAGMATKNYCKFSRRFLNFFQRHPGAAFSPTDATGRSRLLSLAVRSPRTSRSHLASARWPAGVRRRGDFASPAGEPMRCRRLSRAAAPVLSLPNAKLDACVCVCVCVAGQGRSRRVFAVSIVRNEGRAVLISIIFFYTERLGFLRSEKFRLQIEV